MSRKKKSLADQLRYFIEKADSSRYRLSQETGIDQAVISRFMHGTGGLSIDGLEALAKALDLELTQRATPAPKAHKGK